MKDSTFLEIASSCDTYVDVGILGGSVLTVRYFRQESEEIQMHRESGETWAVILNNSSVHRQMVLRLTNTRRE